MKRVFIWLLFHILFLSVAPSAAQVPNYQREVEACRAKYPEAWACAHSGRGCATDFVILCARDIQTHVDGRVGLNGKRGNPNDLSQDILAFKDIGTAVDVTRGSAPMEIVDICGSCGALNQHVTWNPAPGGPGDRGAWVNPFSREPSVGGGSAPGAPASSTLWEAKHGALLFRFVPASSPDASFIQRVAEQFEHSFRGEGWGVKAAAAGRPISGDVIARRLPDGRLVGFRIVPASGAPTFYDLSGQVFIDVQPIDHLGVGGAPEQPAPTPPTQPQTPVPTAVNLQPVLDAIAALSAKVAALEAASAQSIGDVGAKVDSLSEQFGLLASRPVPIDFPEYRGEFDLLGRKVPFILRPQR